MYKLIDTSAYVANDEPNITIVDLSNTGELVKKAADEQIQRFVESLQPQPGKVYLHINAMGAGEYYGANRNADYFPEAQLKEYYKTFETSPAHLYRNHVNKNPEIANGKVIFSIYNDRMHRVELIAEADVDLIQDIEARIARGDFPATSMACKTPYDVCSICGNKAHTRQEYCEHLLSQLGRVLPDGRKVMALNLAPLRFFDISIVVRPADVTSSVLQKVAEESGIIVGSAEMAESEGVTEVEKKADINKIADLIKLVDGGEVFAAYKPVLDKVQDPNWGIIHPLSKLPLQEVFKGFGEHGISPSIEFLAELIAQHRAGEDGEGAGPIAAGLVKEYGLHKLGLEEVAGMDLIEGAHPTVMNIISASADTSSLHPEFVEKRASMGTVHGGQVGYLNWERGMKPHFSELEKAPPTLLDEISERTMADLLKSLFGIGAAAVVAKWGITKYIERKSENQPKIQLVKRACDQTLTTGLAKAAMVNSVIGNEQESFGGKIKRKLIGFVGKFLRRNGGTAGRIVGQGISLEGKINQVAKNLSGNRSQTGL